MGGSHRHNELQLESTIRLIMRTHRHKDLEAFLKWPHAKAILPCRLRLHDLNRNLFCHISICWVWVKCLQVRHFPAQSNRHHVHECHSMNTCCHHLGHTSSTPCSRSRRD